MRIRHSLLSFLLIICGAALAAAQVSENEEIKSIDVTINIYQNSNIGTQTAKDAIEEANKILKQAGLRLNVSDSRINPNFTKGDNGGGGGEEGDGKLTETEINWAVYYGDKEVDNGKDGMKISFGDTSPAGTPGGAIHKHPTVVVSDRGNAAQNGETLAHEVLHALTLSGPYKIDDSTTADASGHAPNQPGTSGNGNAMAPSNRRNGTAITPGQKEKIDNDGYANAWSKAKTLDEENAPSVPPATTQQQKGGGCVTDPNFFGASHLDLSRVGLHSTFDDSTLYGLVAMQNVVPGSSVFQASYYLDFDTDSIHPGADRQIQIILQRTTVGGPVSIAGQVNDLTTGIATTFPNLALVQGILGKDVEDLTPTVMESQLEFRVNKSLLGTGTSTSVVPGTAWTTGGGGGSAAPLPISLDLGWWLNQADLLLTQATAAPGDTVTFQIDALTPSTPFSLFLDDLLIPASSTDTNGDYSGSFLFPNVAPGDYYFLTAIDATGRSAFNAIYAVPEPSAIVLLGMAVVGMAIIGRRSRTLMYHPWPRRHCIGPVMTLPGRARG